MSLKNHILKVLKKNDMDKIVYVSFFIKDEGWICRVDVYGETEIPMLWATFTH